MKNSEKKKTFHLTVTKKREKQNRQNPKKKLSKTNQLTFPKLSSIITAVFNVPTKFTRFSNTCIANNTEQVYSIQDCSYIKNSITKHCYC